MELHRWGWFIDKNIKHTRDQWRCILFRLDCIKASWRFTDTRYAFTQYHRLRYFGRKSSISPLFLPIRLRPSSWRTPLSVLWKRNSPLIFNCYPIRSLFAWSIAHFNYARTSLSWPNNRTSWNSISSSRTTLTLTVAWWTSAKTWMTSIEHQQHPDRP